MKRIIYTAGAISFAAALLLHQQIQIRALLIFSACSFLWALILYIQEKKVGLCLYAEDSYAGFYFC